MLASLTEKATLLFTVCSALVRLMFIRLNIFVSLTSVFEPTKAGASKYACWLAQKKKKMEILDTWVFLAQTNSSVRLSLGGLIWQPRMQLSGGWPCGSTVFPGEKWVVWYEGEKDLHCDVIHCDVTRRDRPTCSENLRQGSVNMRSHFSYRVRAQLVHLSLCCAWAVFQVRDENENVPFVWNWSHCYLYETPFFQIQAPKKKGLGLSLWEARGDRCRTLSR